MYARRENAFRAAASSAERLRELQQRLLREEPINVTYRPKKYASMWLSCRYQKKTIEVGSQLYQFNIKISG